jgi:hypothetical protein
MTNIQERSEEDKVYWFRSPVPGDQSFEATCRWFQSLSVEERLDHLCEVMDLMQRVAPEVIERKNRTARPLTGSYRVLELPSSPNR